MPGELPNASLTGDSALSRVLRRPPSPRALAEGASRFVIGQDKALQELAVVVRQHLLKVRAWSEGGATVPTWRDPVLLIGPTGVGKTYMVRVLTALCGLPFHAEDCALLSGTAYVGRSVPDALQGLIRAADSDVRLAQRGVLFLDELDKVRVQHSDGRDVKGNDVQAELLGVVEGRPLHLANTALRERSTTYQGRFETHQLCLIAAGAFEGLSEAVRERLHLKTARIGFRANSERPAQGQTPEGDLLAQVTPEDLITYGMKPELAGRFHTIIALRDVAEEDLEAILTQAPAGALARLGDVASLDGLKLEFSSEFVTAAAALARDAGLGARPLETLVSRATRRALFEVPGAVPSGTTLRFGAPALQNGSYDVVFPDARSAATVGSAPWLTTDHGSDTDMELALDAFAVGSQQTEGGDRLSGVPVSLGQQIDDLILNPPAPEDGPEDEIEIPPQMKADMRALEFMQMFDGETWHPNNPKLGRVVFALIDPDLHEASRLILLHAGVAILPRLLALTGDRSPIRRLAAVWVLARLDNPVAREMVAYVSAHDPDEDVRRVAAECAGAAGSDADDGECGGNTSM